MNSGAGLVILEATAVKAEGRISPDCLGLWDDRTEEALRENLQRSRKNSPHVPVFIQLAHAGRKASTSSPWKGHRCLNKEEGGWVTEAPSPIPYSDEQKITPHALTEKEIQNLLADFASSAERAERAGLDGIEIHGANGYLIHEFLSPLSNHRDDRYGGSYQNRIRFCLEVFQSIRSTFKGPLGIRLSASDWVEGGWTPEETADLAVTLKEMGCAYVHVISGGLLYLQKISEPPHYQVPFSKAVKQKSDIVTIANGLITDPHEAERILQEGDADCVALARGFLYNPRWGWTAAAALGEKVSVSPQYLRCAPHGFAGIFEVPK